MKCPTCNILLVINTESDGSSGLLCTNCGYFPNITNEPFPRQFNPYLKKPDKPESDEDLLNYEPYLPFPKDSKETESEENPLKK